MPNRRSGARVRSVGLCPLAAALWVAVAAALACGGEAPLAPELEGERRCSVLSLAEPRPDANVVLVLNDTMRRDFTGLHGRHARTPQLEAFAAEHLVFENAISQATWTKPSVATLFTSLYPSQHRVASSPQVRQPGTRRGEGELVRADVLAPSLVTLAEHLSEAGLRTAGFTTNPWMERRFGFGQGFEVYEDGFARWGAEGDAVIDAGLAWLDTLDADAPYFLYLHTIDTHRPYGHLPDEELGPLRARLNATPRLASEEGIAVARSVRIHGGERALQHGFLPTRGLVRAAYASGVEDFDAVLGRLLDRLRSRSPEAWERTAVIVTSDHGEALFDRGYGNHGTSLFDDEAAIPLVARLPGVMPARGRVDCLVGLVDVFPTLCDYVGSPCPAAARGWSFLATEESADATERRYLVTEGVMDEPERRAIRNRRFKLERRGAPGSEQYALYDLEADPGERRNRNDPRFRDAATRRTVEQLQARLHTAVEELPAPEGGSAVLDPELRDRLEALGYGVGGAAERVEEVE